MLEATDAIYTLLSGATSVTSLIGAVGGAPNIFPLQAPEVIGGQASYIIIKKISDVEEYAHDGASGLTAARIQIDSVAPTYAAAKAIKNAVRDLLTAYRGQPAGTASGTALFGVFRESEHDFAVPSAPDENLRSFGFSQDYLIWSAV